MWQLIKRKVYLIWIFGRVQTMSRMESLVGFYFVIFGTLLGMAVNVIFFKAIFLRVTLVGGWQFEEVLVLLGLYYMINAFSWMTYYRGLVRLPRYVETGGLDTWMVRPVDLKFAFSYFWLDLFFSTPQFLVGLGMVWYGSRFTAEPLGIGIFLVLLVCALCVHRALVFIWFSVNFFTISYMLGDVFSYVIGFGRFPINIYQGIAKFVLSFIIPIAFMFSVPARVVTGHLDWLEIVTAVIITLVFCVLSNIIWGFSLKHYESANG